MNPSTPWLIYGATGYTGRLIARHAVERGHRPVLAGRRADAVGALASSLGLDHRAFPLEGQALLDGLAGVAAVLHCAGPFSETALPMAEACLATGTHYLDITGEIGVFEMLAGMHARARDAGVVLLPGVGLDVVPSDCLALFLKQCLPDATHLALAFTSGGGISHGTAKTMLKHLGQGGAIRRDGKIVPVPHGWGRKTVDFGRGPRETVSIPWGDVATAWHSTGIPNIVVYTVPPPALGGYLRAPRVASWFLSRGPVRWLLGRVVDAALDGPDDQARARGTSRFVGEVTDGGGRTASARLTGPEGYTMTMHTALLAMERILGGEIAPGFQTPAKAFGPDFVLEVPGVTRHIAHDGPEAT